MSASPDTSEAAPTLPATLRLGPVHLAVTDLDRSIGFYRDAIGLRLHHREGAAAVMGAGAADLLVLLEEPNARPAARHAGLYHFALLHPSRLELARAAKRLIAGRVAISGASDHGISEAIYLPDPDGNGIELAADRPRAEWGDLRDPSVIGPKPLDLEGLLALVADEEPAAQADAGLVVGHLHLHVGDVEEGLAFYRDVLGFEPMTLFPSAAFVSAGGYHHHLAFNTWRGAGAAPAPDGVVGLRRWTVFLERDSELEDVRERAVAAGGEPVDVDGGVLLRDPWGHPVLFATAPSG
ncbi:catechol 2,3-dioxygenase [soil metagenome]